MSPLATQASDEENGPCLTGMVNLHGDVRYFLDLKH